jgi:hypothetical protein
MKTGLIIAPLATAILCGLLPISQSVTAQNQSSPPNMTGAIQMNKISTPSNLSIPTNSTNTSAVGNVSENIKDVYNTTQTNNALMSK